VEGLFEADASAGEPVLGPPLANGTPVLAARVGAQVTYASAASALAIDGWPAANAVLEDEGVRLLPRSDLEGLLVVGCDPAVAMAAALLPGGGRQRVIALSGSTGAALSAMRAGRAHAALVHGRPDRLPRAPANALRVHLARWRVGVASRGSRARSVAELCERRARVVQRDAGASTQAAFVSALAAAGGSSLPGPLASGHLDAARRIVHGATAGVTMEPAALRYGLAFSALEEHVAELWIDARWRAHPGVGALRDVLRSRAFTARMSLVPGYELAGCGDETGRRR
jgi:molybdate-binding protein